jgi:predicted HicB family RNase H-like nuclease
LNQTAATPERVITESAPKKGGLAVSLSAKTVAIATERARAKGISLEAYLLHVLEQAVKAERKAP